MGAEKLSILQSLIETLANRKKEGFMALAPGFFRSAQTIWAFEENKELGEKLLARVPMGRMGKLEELEGTIVYLASEASGYMTGQTLTLDGGFLSW